MALSDQAAINKDRLTRRADFQHRHFATIAAILREKGADNAECEYWADALRSTNDAFDRRRFLRAAQPE